MCTLAEIQASPAIWRLVIIATVVLAFPILYLCAGFLLVRFKKSHKLGCMLWAMSGLFLKRLPRHCRQTCDRSCGNWTCPRYHKLSINTQKDPKTPEK